MGTLEIGTIVVQRMGESQGTTVSATSLNAPKDAKKAFDKGHQAVEQNKLTEAQPELEKAVQLYPQYASAWLDLGWVYSQQNLLEKARNAFQQAHAADDKFVPAYVGLSSIAVRESKWQEAAEQSARATELDGVDFPAAFYYNSSPTIAWATWSRRRRAPARPRSWAPSMPSPRSICCWE
jgi:tetratricopeptide (TPR) repeat protein